MDVNEATQMLKVTDEEIKAVQNYLDFTHTSINLLSDLNPRAYDRLTRSGWLLAENKDDLKNKIKTFVDIYSLMYKNSLNEKGRRGLIRGTSGERARAITKTSRQFLSTSKDENVAKRFCEAENPALVRISIGEGVPRLYSEDYMTSVVNEDEQEVIIAPFCKVKDNQLVSRWNGYEYYSVSIEKGELQEKSAEEIESLKAQVVEGYDQNIADMKEYMRLIDRQDYLKEKLNRTYDDEGRTYYSQELKKAEDDFYNVWKRTTQYKENLNALLQGMCREKEKEIDQAKDIVDNDREEKRKENEARKQEEDRKKAIDEFSQKIGGAFGNTERISSGILSTYQQLIDKENSYKQFARDLGVGFSSSVEGALQKSVTGVTSVAEKVGKSLKQVQIPDDSTVKQVQEQSARYTGIVSKIDASKGIVDALPEVVDLFAMQAEDTIKRDLYLKMHALIKGAKINLLQQQKFAIENQKLGLFDMITGKTKVQDLQLKNIALRMQLISETIPEEKSYYSVHDMLAEIYTFSQTELGGQYTPELERMFTAMQSKFRSTNGKSIDLEQIKKQASPKIEEYRKQNLPAIPKKRFRLFGKNKNQIENLEYQNSQVQTQINNVGARKLISRLKPPAKLATTIFQERLKGIEDNLKEEGDGPTRTQEKTSDNTVDLWK